MTNLRNILVIVEVELDGVHALRPHEYVPLPDFFEAALSTLIAGCCRVLGFMESLPNLVAPLDVGKDVLVERLVTLPCVPPADLGVSAVFSPLNRPPRFHHVVQECRLIVVAEHHHIRARRAGAPPLSVAPPRGSFQGRRRCTCRGGPAPRSARAVAPDLAQKMY